MNYKNLKLSYEEESIFGKTNFHSLKELKDSTIVSVGFIPKESEGGFTIDYKLKGEKKIKRLVLGYTELGTWIKFHGYKSGGGKNG